MSAKDSCDFLIIGGGMVGLSIANQILSRNLAKSVVIIEKEESLGLHSSGRNSGVLHAGLYYNPDSLRARVCVNGSKLLKQWVSERKIPINNCGKVIVPQRADLDSQLDILEERGRKNGANVEFLDDKTLKEIVPEARTASGRALWSPGTSVVNPKTVLLRLQSELQDRGVRIITGQRNWTISTNDNYIKLHNSSHLYFDIMINCAGLHSDEIAHKCNVGNDYVLLPFKGTYWQLKNNSSIKPRVNLYPVPDLNVPFLGVHFTPGVNTKDSITIGPTAIPAFGRENYQNLEGFDMRMSIRNLLILSNQYLSNKGGFRKYTHEQAFLIIPKLLVREAKQLIPSINYSDIEPSKKVGIRPQLFNLKTKAIENDFLCLPSKNSIHLLNVISPAFTASFALADLVLDKLEDLQN